MSFLLDTNVLSETRKPRADARLRAWIAEQPNASLHTSVLVLGEIRHGIHLLGRRDPDAARGLTAWLRGVRRGLRPRVLDVTEEVADLWAELGIPDPLSPIDGLIAATALLHDLTVVTRTVRHFERAGVKVLNPFSDA